MRLWPCVIAACSVAFLAAGAAPTTEKLDIGGGGPGELVATLHTGGDGVVAFDFLTHGCFFVPDHPEICFTFTAVNGTDEIPINGCRSDNDGKLQSGAQVGCRAKGIKQVKLVLASGGTVNLYGGNGQNDGCSPAPVTIEAHGDAYHVAAWDGCVETITCVGGMGQVDVDANDQVGSSCSAAFVTRHGAQ